MGVLEWSKLAIAFIGKHESYLNQKVTCQKLEAIGYFNI